MFFFLHAIFDSNSLGSLPLKSDSFYLSTGLHFFNEGYEGFYPQGSLSVSKEILPKLRLDGFVSTGTMYQLGIAGEYTLLQEKQKYPKLSIKSSFTYHYEANRDSAFQPGLSLNLAKGLFFHEKPFFIYLNFEYAWISSQNFSIFQATTDSSHLFALRPGISVEFNKFFLSADFPIKLFGKNLAPLSFQVKLTIPIGL
jgi:hypothetical protein